MAQYYFHSIMVIDESERIPKCRFYSSEEVQMSRETTEESSEDSTKGAPTFAKIPKQGPLRRTCSVPTSFKERKRHFQTHKRSKTSPLPIIRRSTSTNLVPSVADKKRKWRSYETPCPERHHCRRWAYVATKRRVQSIPHSENVFYRKHESRR